MKIRFTRQATEDLSEIADYLGERNPHAARRVRAAIDDALRLLGEFPLAGRLQSTPGVRKLLTPKYSYVVYYTVNADHINILSLQHPSQRREHEDA